MSPQPRQVISGGQARKHNRRTKEEEIRSRDFKSSQAARSDHRPPKSGILRSLWMPHLAGGVCLACIALGAFWQNHHDLRGWCCELYAGYGSAGSVFDEDGESIPVVNLNLSRKSSDIRGLWRLDPWDQCVTSCRATSLQMSHAAQRAQESRVEFVCCRKVECKEVLHLRGWGAKLVQEVVLPMQDG